MEDQPKHDDLNNSCPACKRDHNEKVIKNLEGAIEHIDKRYTCTERQVLRAGVVSMLEDVKKEQEELTGR